MQRDREEVASASQTLQQLEFERKRKRSVIVVTVILFCDQGNIHILRLSMGSRRLYRHCVNDQSLIIDEFSILNFSLGNPDFNIIFF